MSKKSKKASKFKHLMKKRAIRAQNKARFAEMRRLGQNSKSLRFRRKLLKTRLVKTVSHIEGPCGNIGCKRCDKYGVANLQLI